MAGTGSGAADELDDDADDDDDDSGIALLAVRLLIKSSRLEILSFNVLFIIWRFGSSPSLLLEVGTIGVEIDGATVFLGVRGGLDWALLPLILLGIVILTTEQSLPCQ